VPFVTTTRQGAVLQRLTFVDNVTAGANAVLRSLRWRSGERIVIADCPHPGVTHYFD
jgi:selenocysteine lyase/cysteine desulfurase